MKEIVIDELEALMQTYRPHGVWSAEEEEILKKYYRKVPSAALVKYVGHSWEACKQKAGKLGIVEPRCR